MERLQSPTGDSEPAFNLWWNSLYDLSDRSADGTHDGQVRFSLRYVGRATDDPTIEALIADLSIDPDLPDSRARGIGTTRRSLRGSERTSSNWRWAGTARNSLPTTSKRTRS